jgi:hypothetical protein
VAGAAVPFMVPVSGAAKAGRLVRMVGAMVRERERERNRV